MRILLALALAGCAASSDGGAGGDGPLILEVSEVGTPGGTIFVLTATEASQVEVLINGRLAEVERTVFELSLVKVPASQPIGSAMLTTRLAGTSVERDHRVIKIVEASFRKVESETGLVFEHDITDWPEMCAQAMTGVGFADIDSDGDLDAFVGNLSTPSTFFVNDGDTDGDGLPNFTPDTAAVGLSGIDLVSAVNFADYDNDGDPDLFLGRRAPNRIFNNDGGVFTDVTDAVGLPPYPQRTMGGGWGDWDNDGDLDLFVSNHAWCYPNANDAIDHRNADHFYRNDGGTFTELTDLFANTRGQMTGRFGFVSIFLDIDRDADQDLVVLNDLVPNGGLSVVWENQGAAQDHAMVTLGPNSGFASNPDAGNKVPNPMGLAVGDLNGDRRPDFAYSNIGHNGLVLSDTTTSGVLWVDGAERGGVWRDEHPWYMRSVTWATHLFDYDNDTDLDLMYIGGDLRGAAPHPHAFFVNNGDNTFVDRTWHAGLESAGHGKSSALLDLDGDGFLEMVVANWTGQLEVYRNELPDLGNTNHWLQVELEGDGVAVNRDAFGGIVELTEAEGRVQTCFRTPQPSLSGTGDPMCHFGLGAVADAVSIEVFWPDGTEMLVTDIQPDQRIVVRY